MTDKQFNFILSRLHRDIWDSIASRAFPIKNDSVYVDGVKVVCVDDVYNALKLYFSELKDEETLK